MRYILSLFEWNEKREVSSDLNLKKGSVVVVDLGFGKHLGEICETLENENKSKPACIENEAVIMRKATSLEKEKAKLTAKKRNELMQGCRKLIKKYNLPMKLVGADVSVDGGGIIFGFTAEERIDFRSLVRELAAIFQKSVRLQQLGSRDEAKMCGGMGPCGRAMCCLSRNLPIQSISTEMARLQQISHRGNERLSGCCNRLMCCLAFEQDTYEKMRAKLPNMGDEVNTYQGSGIVENLKILSQEVGVKLENSKDITWMSVDKIKNNCA